ncbi:hypothetical protein BVRB_8g195360 [Beta vulgaris subsp. vulgaris]|nr:hypothetical protein BVRB_8g195360 [Beta vulgaris subsp. vulgaris]
MAIFQKDLQSYNEYDTSRTDDKCNHLVVDSIWEGDDDDDDDGTYDYAPAA